MIDHWSSQVSPVRIMRLSPFTLSTHNCFIHAVIVTYSDFAINIHTSLFLSSWHGPCVQPIPDHSLEHETITSHSMYWLLWFPAVYLMSTRPTRSVPTCHSGRWAFHHTVCGYYWLFRSHYYSPFGYDLAINVIDILDFCYAYSPWWNYSYTSPLLWLLIRPGFTSLTYWRYVARWKRWELSDYPS